MMMAESSWVHYFHSYDKRSIGEKRNFGISKASSQLILMWDDDDYSVPSRIYDQIQPIIEGKVDMTLWELSWVFNTDGENFYNPKLPWAILPGTVAFRRSIFETVQYPDVSLGEDVYFVNMAIEKG
jgi:glycosyltransferase involved in cell wall biosynthesis